jgi:hypothetical protein
LPIGTEVFRAFVVFAPDPFTMWSDERSAMVEEQQHLPQTERYTGRTSTVAAREHSSCLWAVPSTIACVHWMWLDWLYRGSVFKGWG